MWRGMWWEVEEKMRLLFACFWLETTIHHRISGFDTRLLRSEFCLVLDYRTEEGLDCGKEGRRAEGG
jgi:hypothetical protein